MDSVNKTLYIPLYGKALVSSKNKIIQDKKAEEIWEKEKFPLKGKSKSKWLAYYMAMRSAVYDEWVQEELKNNSHAVVLHIGCGMDSRSQRVSRKNTMWYDIDFPDVIQERRKYYEEEDTYYMVAVDMRTEEWKEQIEANQDAIIILEGVSMYLKPQELKRLFLNLAQHFHSIKLLMDCYTKKAAKVSKYKNPINDVGVTKVYGYDIPEELAKSSGLVFLKEHTMTPQKYIQELEGVERRIFQKLFAGKVGKSMYKMYEFEAR